MHMHNIKCICWYASITDTLSNLEQVIYVGAETFGKDIKQLAECHLCAGGGGVAVGAESADQVGASLQYGDLCVLLHNATYLGQQQVQMLNRRSRI